jgi:hypothetical protein
VEASEPLQEEDLFRAIESSGARALLIGRQALIVLGAPVATHDYDFWIHFDDVERMNAAMATLDLMPNQPPDEARARGRYAYENGERIDVMIARSKTTNDGDTTLSFDDAWNRRREVWLTDGVRICIPRIRDLIVTKRWAMRPKDIPDIQLLEALLREEGESA